MPERLSSAPRMGDKTIQAGGRERAAPTRPSIQFNSGSETVASSASSLTNIAEKSNFMSASNLYSDHLALQCGSEAEEFDQTDLSVSLA